MSALFLKVLHMSVCASWLVLAVLLLRLCLRRAPKWFNVLLWGIVAVRLVFPFSVESPLSLLPRTEAIRPAITTVQTQPAQISSAAAGRRLCCPGAELAFDPRLGLARGSCRTAPVYHGQHAAAAAQGTRGGPPAGKHLPV